MRHQLLRLTHHPRHVAHAQFIAGVQGGGDGQPGRITESPRRRRHGLDLTDYGQRGADPFGVRQARQRRSQVSRESFIPPYCVCWYLEFPLVRRDG